MGGLPGSKAARYLRFCLTYNISRKFLAGWWYTSAECCEPESSARNLAGKNYKLRLKSRPFVEDGAHSPPVEPETESILVRELSDLCFALRLV